ncbi:THAP domain-containing protein 11 isoform X1 [Ornithorhynchus anatinus]|uniref:THAP domain-containing protein 11 n=1 Tax=Ornithorhynchus anatinus TaxID=9258 RepID=W8C8H4_ORNAN|nr:THAP domain-containing protein 11 isoform X1 [Ornithorhynchus anatinus]
MPGFTCCVPGCYNNSHRDKTLHFYTFPKDAELRRLWLKNVSRAGVNGCFSTFQPTTGHRLCSVHFQGGRKTYSVRIPTIFPLRGVSERKSTCRPGPEGSCSAGTSPSRRQRQKQLQEPKLQPLVPTPAGVLLTLKTAVKDSQTPVAPPLLMGGNKKSVDITGKTGFTALDGAPEAGPDMDHSSINTTEANCSAAGVRFMVEKEEGFQHMTSDHSYSLSSCTTEEELLHKLNEQRDILALMEVKMKEMKDIIRQLRLTEANLREELREKDRLLAMAVNCK